MDYVNAPGVDLVHDLNDGKLPFPDNSVQEVYASHVFEHLVHWEDVIMEVFRVLEPGGILTVRVPHGRGKGAYLAIHLRVFMPNTMDSLILEPVRKVPSYHRAGMYSIQPFPRFECVSKRIVRHIPFEWHIQHHLGIDMTEGFYIGPPCEIVWVLRKPVTEGPIT